MNYGMSPSRKRALIVTLRNASVASNETGALKLRLLWPSPLATPKALNSKAQGRAAHPGLSGPVPEPTLNGLHTRQWHPYRVQESFWSNLPGCATRPWALLDNRFAVRIPQLKPLLRTTAPSASTDSISQGYDQGRPGHSFRRLPMLWHASPRQ